ncbi:MAG: hypothetical protein OHK0031_07930 [Anaerolineales bacterium]
MSWHGQMRNISYFTTFRQTGERSRIIPADRIKRAGDADPGSLFKGGEEKSPMRLYYSDAQKRA